MIGLLSQSGKDYNPSALDGKTWDKNPMEKRDPFIEGLRIVLAANPDLKPAPLAKAADLDDSTLRKALNGNIKSLTVDKAARIAKAAGFDLSTIVALGEHSNGRGIIDMASALQNADEDVRREIEGYLRVKLAQGQASAEPQQALQSIDSAEL